MNNRISGKIGEAAAEAFLKRRGHRIITVNYRTYGGELDIVSVHKGILVFTEVKTKSTSFRGAPVGELTYDKERRLLKAGYWFRRVDGKEGKVPYYVGKLRFTLKYKKYRYDLVEVYLHGGTARQIIHTKNVIKTER
ncbi:MAG: YraN family protein [Clostridia bacterium]|nr:YraN family protein [Clostridia bacterium]